MDFINGIVKHPLYIAIVFFAVMPISGALIQRGDMWEGIIIIIMNVPWFFTSVIYNTIGEKDNV